jgi:hypothetical protein
MLSEPPGASKEDLFGLLKAWKDPADTHQVQIAAAINEWSSSPTFLPDCLSLLMDPSFSDFFRHIHLLITRYSDLYRVPSEFIAHCREGAAFLADLIRSARSDGDVAVYAASYQRVLFEVGFETLDGLIADAFEQLASQNSPDIHRAICILANIHGLLSKTANPAVVAIFEWARFYENFVQILAPYFDFAVGTEDFDRCLSIILRVLGRARCRTLFNQTFWDASLDGYCFFLTQAVRILGQLAELDELPSYASDLAETCMYFVTQLFYKITLRREAGRFLERIPDFPRIGLRVVSLFPFDHPTTRLLLQFFLMEGEFIVQAVPFELDDAVRFLIRSTALTANDLNLAGENPVDFWSLAYGHQADTSAARGEAIQLLKLFLDRHTAGVMGCAVQVFQQPTDDPESIVRVGIEIVRMLGVSDELFDILGPLCELIDGDNLPERICRLSQYYLMALLAEHVDPHALLQIGTELVQNWEGEFEQICFTVGCRVLRSVPREVIDPDVVGLIVAGSPACLSDDASHFLRTLALDEGTAAPQAVADALAVAVLRDLQDLEEEEDGLSNERAQRLRSLLSGLAAVLALPEAAIGREHLQALVDSLPHIPVVTEYLDEMAMFFRSVFKALPVSDALCAHALESWLDLWESHQVTSDIVRGLFGFFDRGWDATDVHFRADLLRRLIKGTPQPLDELGSGFAIDTGSWVTMISRLIQSRVPFDPSILEPVFPAIQAGISGFELIFEADLVLSLVFAGIDGTDEHLERILGGLLETNMLFSNYHRRLLILAMREREASPEVAAMIQEAHTACSTDSQNLIATDEDASVAQVFNDDYPAPIYAIEIQGFVEIDSFGDGEEDSRDAESSQMIDGME